MTQDAQETSRQASGDAAATSEIDEAQLDAWVAQALGYKHLGAVGEPYDDARKDERYRFCLSGQNDWWDSPKGHWICGPCEGFPLPYSTDWGRGGPLIERNEIRLSCADNKLWWAEMRLARDGSIAYQTSYHKAVIGIGKTPLGAAMRCFVKARYGEISPGAAAVSSNESASKHDEAQAK